MGSERFEETVEIPIRPASPTITTGGYAIATPATAITCSGGPAQSFLLASVASATPTATTPPTATPTSGATATPTTASTGLSMLHASGRNIVNALLQLPSGVTLGILDVKGRRFVGPRAPAPPPK